MKIYCTISNEDNLPVGSKVKISSPTEPRADGKWGIIKKVLNQEAYLVDIIGRGGHNPNDWVELYPHEIVSYYLPKVSTATGRYIDIQNEVIEKYDIIMDENSSCRMRTHCHPKERRICKFHQQNSARSTFLLFHEIGHAETTKSSMRRCEKEYYATKWAIEKAKEYGIDIPDDVIRLYQNYIDQELYRGQRRGGSNYNVDMDLYKLL